MKCYNCKALIPEGTDTCPECGRAQTVTKELIDAAAGGDQNALSDLYNRTYNAVYNSVKFMVKDEDAALDILQDSYIKAFDSLEQLQEPGRFEPWIKRIAHNKAVDYLRAAKPISFSDMAADDSDDIPEFEDDRPENLPELVIDRRETARLINEILDSLPDDQRACICLYYYDQLSVREIAAELGIPEATVKSRLQYGRRKIEARVRELEKKGTKLYGVAPVPFLMLLFRQQAQTAAASPVLPESIMAHTAARTGSGTVTSGAAGAAAKAAVKHAAVHTVRTAAATKFIAAVAAVAVIGGGAAAVHHVRQAQREPAAIEAALPAESETPEHPQLTAVPEEPPVPPEPKAQVSVAGPGETVPDLRPACLEEIVGRYADILEANGPDYLASHVGGQRGGINYDLIAEFFTRGGTVYGGWTDLNGDGSPELLIALGDETYRQVWAAYSTDGRQAYELCDSQPLGYRVNLYVLPDGQLMIHGSGGVSSGSDTICEIAPDGRGLIVLAYYVYDELTNGSMDHISDKGTLSDAEFSERYWAHAVDAAEYGNIRYFVIKSGEAPSFSPEPEAIGPAESAGSWADAYQDVLVGYQLCMSGDAAGGSPYRRYEKVRFALEVRDGTRVIQYGLYDVNRDGTPELVMALNEAYSDGIAWIMPFEIYTFDGTEAVPVCLEILEDHESLHIGADGTIWIDSGNSGFSPTTFYELPARGVKPRQTAFFDAVQDGSGGYYRYIVDGTEQYTLSRALFWESYAPTDAAIVYHSILKSVYSVADVSVPAGPSEDMIGYIKSQLGIPADLETEDIVDLDNPSYWEAGDMWLINCEFYHNGTLVAAALADSRTGDLARNILMYTGN